VDPGPTIADAVYRSQATIEQLAEIRDCLAGFIIALYDVGGIPEHHHAQAIDLLARAGIDMNSPERKEHTAEWAAYRKAKGVKP
jgi:hypothetical protein